MLTRETRELSLQWLCVITRKITHGNHDCETSSAGIHGSFDSPQSTAPLLFLDSPIAHDRNVLFNEDIG